MPRFSIIISAYNAEKYIEECLDSIQNQDFKDYEVIVVDDGSIDKTYKICQRYAENDNRIILYHWENHGLICARRKGLSIAHGEYILFLDADDYYLNNALKRIDFLLNLHKSPDMLIFRFQFAYEKGRVAFSRDFGEITYFLNNDVMEREKLLIDTANCYEYNHLCCKVICRKLFLQESCDYEKFTDVQLGEDLLQTVPLMIMSDRVVLVSDVLYGYRVIQTSMSHFFKEKQIKDINMVYEHIIEDILPQMQVGEKVQMAFYDAYMAKICSLMRTLWESSIQYKDKIYITGDILSFPLMKYADMGTNHIPFQNKIFFFLANKRMWGILNLYGKLIKII